MGKKLNLAVLAALLSFATSARADWSVIDNQPNSESMAIFSGSGKLYSVVNAPCSRCISPTNSSQFIGRGVVRRSDDGGTTWTTIFTSGIGTNLYSGVVTSAGNIFLTADENGKFASIYASYDDGATFRKVLVLPSSWMLGSLHNLVVTPNGKIVAACICEARTWIVRTSVDEGKTWQGTTPFKGETGVSTPTSGPSFVVDSKDASFYMDAFSNIFRLSVPSTNGEWLEQKSSIGGWIQSGAGGLFVDRNDVLYSYGYCDRDCDSTGAEKIEYLRISRWANMADEKHR